LTKLIRTYILLDRLPLMRYHSFSSGTGRRARKARAEKAKTSSSVSGGVFLPLRRPSHKRVLPLTTPFRKTHTIDLAQLCVFKEDEGGKSLRKGGVGEG